MLFTVRPIQESYGGLRVVTHDPVAALGEARAMEARGLVVEIVDPLGGSFGVDLFEASGQAAGLTGEHIQLIEETCDVLLSANTRAADIFYEHLFALAPETRAMFSVDMTGQKRKLLDMLGSLVGYLTHPDVLGGIVAELGRRHAGYGVEPAHYGPAGAALLASLEELLGSRVTPEVKAAWTALYSHLSRSMLKATPR